MWGFLFIKSIAGKLTTHPPPHPPDSKPLQATPEMSYLTELCCWETGLGKHKERSQKIKRDDDYYHISQSNQMTFQSRRAINPNNFSK